MGKKYITEEEKIKCKAVTRVFQELYDKEDIIVLVAGDYGIVVLQWYMKNRGFEQITTFTDWMELYKFLWEQWREYELFRRMKGTELEEADFEIMYKVWMKGAGRNLGKKEFSFGNYSWIICILIMFKA